MNLNTLPSLIIRSVMLMATIVAMFFAQSAIARDAGQETSDPLEALTENFCPLHGGNGIVPRFSLSERMDRYGVPGVAIAIIKDGKVTHARGFGVLQAGGSDLVDENTLFSIGSVSKVAAAVVVLKLQADDRLDVDRDVRDYLKSWQMPTSPENAPVTLRMLLSHTAGFNLHGFGDFAPGAALPTVYDTLNGAEPATHEPLRFISKPGTRYRYSGGGYTLAQLVVTDITQKDFPAIARSVLFEPLSMGRSTYANPLPASVGNIAKAHDRRGRPTALPRGYEAMPEMAASGLWTSAAELGQFVAMLIESYRGQDGYLPQSIAEDMMTRVNPGEHGLGPSVEGIGTSRWFHHGGANNSYKAWIEGHLATGDGLVVLTNGNRGHEIHREIRKAAAGVFGWKP